MECTFCHTVIDDDAAYCPECGKRLPGAPEHAEYDYAAFISYRHRSPDSDVARWLHRKLETYRLPADVAQSYGARKLGRVFRDEDELPATDSLPASIREALKRSRTLVVVCSPTTPESRWVEREIELFASFHGRDRVFAVLAEGKSSESMPARIRFASHVDNAEGTSPLDAEPFAADMRSRSARERSREALRIIAAIAGCPYDSLVRRNRARTARRVVASAAACAMLAAGIGAFALQAQKSQQDALAAESARKAAESREQLAHGNRYEAIELALEALPKSGADQSRPVSDEAISALEEALGLHPSPSSAWSPAYSLNTGGSVSVIGNTGMVHQTDSEDIWGISAFGSITPSADGKSFAIVDDTGALSVHDTASGRCLANHPAAAPAEGAPSAGSRRRTPTTVAACSGAFAVARAGAAGSFECLDDRTFEPRWTREDVAPASISPSEDGSAIGAVALTADGNLETALVDVQTGETVAQSSFSLDPGLSPDNGIACAMGALKTDLFTTVDATLVHTHADADAGARTPLAHPEVASAAYGADTALAATVEEFDGENLGLEYAIEAFDDDLRRKWSFSDSLSSEMMVNGDFTALVQGWPAFRGFTLEDGTGVVASAGKRVYVFAAETGEVLLERDLASTVVAAEPASLGDDSPYCLLTMCADGSIRMLALTGGKGNTSVDAYRFDMGEDVRWGTFVFLEERLVALAASAESADRLVAYQIDYARNAETEHRSYSLDELIELAEEVLGR